MRSIAWAFVAVITVLVSHPAMAWRQPDKNALVERVLVLSGRKSAARQMSGMIEKSFSDARQSAGIYRGREEMTPEQKESAQYMIDIMRESFDPDAMLKTIAGHVSKTTTEEQLAKTIKMYNQPMIKRVVNQEVKASASMSPRLLRDYAVKLQKQPPSRKRMALVNHVDQVTNASGLMTDLSMDIIGAFMNGNAQQMARLRAVIEKSSKERTLLTLLYAYRNLTDRDLDAYVDLYRDEDFAWVARMMSRGVGVAMNDAFGSFKGALVDWASTQIESQARWQ